ncbi:MAG: hypothetical protein ABIH22_01240 [Candidatus Margulisiibacteriota bacterium]
MKNSFTLVLIALALCASAAMVFAAGITIPSGSTLDINTATLVVPGDITNNGTLEATTGIIQLTGNWTNEATFTSGTGTVEFTGTSGTTQIISGDNSFYNFLCSSGGLILSFEAFATGSSTQEITGAFNVNGELGSLIYITSTTDGSQAHINPSGTRSISYVDVKDSYNVEGTEIDPPNSVDSGNNTNWFTDVTPPSTPESVSAEALPSASPTYVQLTWEASTDEGGSGLAGYNVYRATTPEGTYSKIMSLVTTTTTNDTTVVLGTDYYFKVTAQDVSSNESGYSNMASAPLLALTREAVVAAPVTYSGGATDPVPGATITYYMYYNNIGFAKASSITIIDNIPTNTEYKMNTATGESITTVAYSSDEATSWTYTPSGTYIDASVTHIKWSCEEMSSGGSAEVEYGAVIK